MSPAPQRAGGLGIRVQHAILAGGLGTRLRVVAGGTPKALVLIHGRPFMEWILEALRRRGVRRAVLCTGYGHDRIAAALGDGRRLGVHLTYSVEALPLGTGGAAALALPLLADPFVLWNGDTFSTVHWRRLLARHAMHRALVTIAVVRVPDARDFGFVALGKHDRVLAFEEKGATGPQWINGGAYAISHAALHDVTADKPCSLEREVFPRLVARKRGVFAYCARRPVFDIGTPDRLSRFAKELSGGQLVRP